MMLVRTRASKPWEYVRPARRMWQSTSSAPSRRPEDELQTLIASIASSGRYTDALDVLFAMKQKGLTPNGTHHLAALRACRVAAEGTISMPEDRFSARSPERRMKSMGVNVRNDFGLDAARKARRLLLRMRKPSDGSSKLACPRGYEETLRTLAAAGRADDALEVLSWMREDKVAPENMHLIFTAVALSRACATIQNNSARDILKPAAFRWSEKCADLLREVAQRMAAEAELCSRTRTEMLQDSKLAKSARRRRKQPASQPFCSATDLNRAVQCAALTAEGKKLLPIILDLGWRSAGITSLIKNLGDANRPEEVLAVFHELADRPQPLNIFHVNCVMSALNRCKRYSSSLAIFKQLLYNCEYDGGRGSFPSPDTFSFSVGATACCESIDMVYEIPQLMRDLSINTNVKVYGALIGSLTRNGRWCEAYNMLHSMWTDDQVTPDVAAVVAVASACTRAGEPTKALALLRPIMPNSYRQEDEATDNCNSLDISSLAESTGDIFIDINNSEVPVRRNRPMSFNLKRDCHVQFMAALVEQKLFEEAFRHFKSLSCSLQVDDNIRVSAAVAAAHLKLYDAALQLCASASDSYSRDVRGNGYELLRRPENPTKSDWMDGAELTPRAIAGVVKVAASQNEWALVDKLVHPRVLRRVDKRGLSSDSRRLYEAAMASAQAKRKHEWAVQLLNSFRRRHGLEAASPSMLNCAIRSHRRMQQHEKAFALEMELRNLKKDLNSRTFEK